MKKKLLMASILVLSGPAPAQAGKTLVEYASPVYGSGANKARGYCVTSENENQIRVRLFLLGGAVNGSLNLSQAEAIRFYNEYKNAQKIEELAQGPGDIFRYNARISENLGFTYTIDNTVKLPGKARLYSLTGRLYKPDSITMGSINLNPELWSNSEIEPPTFDLVARAISGGITKCPGVN